MLFFPCAHLDSYSSAQPAFVTVPPANQSPCARHEPATCLPCLPACQHTHTHTHRNMSSILLCLPLPPVRPHTVLPRNPYLVVPNQEPFAILLAAVLIPSERVCP